MILTAIERTFGLNGANSSFFCVLKGNQVHCWWVILLLKDKVIVITGASSGIGAKLAVEAAKQGAITVLTGRNEINLRQTVKQIGSSASYYAMDVADAAHIEKVFQEIAHTYGRIDILVNNAGFGIFASIEELSLEQFEKMMDTNYMGVVRCTKAVLPIMKAAGKGHIVNVASLAGMIGSAKSTSYSATKHAVLGFTNSLRMELRGTSIAVSSVNPGPIATEFFNIADPNGTYVRNINWLMMKPEYVVSKMIRLLHTQRAELNLPPLSAFALKLYGLCPRFIDKVAGKWLNKK